MNRQERLKMKHWIGKKVRLEEADWWLDFHKNNCGGMIREKEVKDGVIYSCSVCGSVCWKRNE